MVGLLWWPVGGDILEGSGQDTADSASRTAGCAHFGIETTVLSWSLPKMSWRPAYRSRSQIIKYRGRTSMAKRWCLKMKNHDESEDFQKPYLAKG